LAAAIAIQAAVLLGAVFVVVVRPLLRSEPEFSAKHTIYLPQRELEYRAALAGFEQTAAMALPLEKLVTTSMVPSGLPALPAMPEGEFSALENTDLLSRDAQALLAQSGLAGSLGAVGGAKSAAAFFGVEDAGERIVVVVNTSVSVRNKAQRRGVSWERIQDEVAGLVDGLEGGTLFGIVQFSQASRTFTEHLVPATEGNRAAARQWVRESLRGNPPVEAGRRSFGHEAALQAAFAFDADVVFLVTDGVLDRREEKGGKVSYPKIPYEQFVRSVRSAAAGATRRPRLHVVGFELAPGDAEAMRRLAREFGGQVREF
jgi:hypothetical protein